MEELDPTQMRIGDLDRRRLADFLRDASAQGRLDAEELDERLAATTSAKTYGDLVPIVIDLPGYAGVVEPAAEPPGAVERYQGYAPDLHPRPEPQPAPAARSAGAPPVAPLHRSSVAILSGVDRRGTWEIAPSHTVVSVMGGANLDLREAVFASRETVINAFVVMGGVEIVVNERTQVLVDGIGIMGGFGESRPKVTAAYDADSPLVRIKGLALMGGVGVTRKPMPGEGTKRPRS
ncbi:DUF1707 SHOCT-like domain-containing protein [Nocardioides sambongensis]|uniref:DUF1707 SHOCT-like domain-containing protein n=1 Tax=Nocardioides sambongensis TaxID=2589074 RepID=UPI001126FD09|nr:DUF1707 domain-containing protein [Nocardioides sambongensis]